MHVIYSFDFNERTYVWCYLIKEVQCIKKLISVMSSLKFPFT